MSTDGVEKNFLDKATAYRTTVAQLSQQRTQLETEFQGTNVEPLLNAVLSSPLEPSYTAAASNSIIDLCKAIGNFLQSGAFYFFAGLALFFYALHLPSNQVHPSLLFLLAILGVAILLFGTGSQASGALASAGAPFPDKAPTDVGTTGVGEVSENHPAAMVAAKVMALKDAIAEANTKPDSDKSAALAAITASANEAVDAANAAKKAAAQLRMRASPVSGGDWGPVKANAAVAGGAAVLAALLGWGIIYYSPKIRTVFSLDDRYQKISISACAAYSQFCDEGALPIASRLKQFSLRDYKISGSMESGAPIHLVVQDRQVRIVLLSEDVNNSSFFQLKIERTTALESTDFEDFLSVAIPISNNSSAAASGDNDLHKPATSNCIQFEGVDRKCPLTQLKVAAINSDRGDRATSKSYSLNFLRGRTADGNVTDQVITPSGAVAGVLTNAPRQPVNVEFDLGLAKRSDL